MQKVLIIGCPGAGKSTFSRTLQEHTGLPLYYLDMIWHRPDRTHLSPEEFDAALGKILEQEAWLMDGNYNRTLERRLQQCDTVFLLDYPLEVCLAGAQVRIGQQREDMPWLETELDEEFRQWVLDFPKDQLPYIYQLLEQYKAEKNIIIFRSREDAAAYLQQRMHDGACCTPLLVACGRTLCYGRKKTIAAAFGGIVFTWPPRARRSKKKTTSCRFLLIYRKISRKAAPLWPCKAYLK